MSDVDEIGDGQLGAMRPRHCAETGQPRVGDGLGEGVEVDAGRDPYYVLGACSPEVADRALDATDNKLGALMACNVVIWEEQPGKQVVYHVSIMHIARLVGIALDNEEMADIVADTGELVGEAFANL
ncbi:MULTISPECIES: DUF302 domain-containing protein [Halobacterium]|uniref:DUF302 domain-containing protein n=1 Tax=Halobacterium TaxID=2239 RepID=UPI001E5D8940|nr:MULTISPECIES: DUF302 domain-containing protein [Halobacterium]MDL0120038.1 DUF302 domain-containing protein [Halobacterium salinarum]MDL0121025.1 DUF302 domain-containing protein [Halobacterium salinarum]MDL0134629.1 DUF302 domain-containing protein [Halobacterium salinarum]UDF60572.1 DUF302 domain-containing protein [Halobacterium sp. BOL4-2]WJK64951.1 DUF302 domain-containing protein [Halobacterium salinarum]